MYGPDGLNTVSTMPAIAGAGATADTWFKPADPGQNNATEFTEDFFNEFLAEHKNLLAGLGVSFIKGSCNQLANAILPRLTTDGYWSSSVNVGGLYGPSNNRRGIRLYEYDSGTAFHMILKFFERSILTSIQTAPDTYLALLDVDMATIRNVLTLYDKIRGAAGADVVFDDSIDVEGDAMIRGKLKNASGADVVVDDGLKVEGGLTVDAAGSVGTTMTVGTDARIRGALDLKHIDVSPDVDHLININWSAGGADHESGAPTAAAAAVVSFIVALNNAGSATNIQPGDSILIPLSSLTTGGQSLVGVSVEVLGTFDGWTTLAALQGLRFAASVGLDSSGNTRLALTYVGRGNLTVAATTTRQALIRVRLNYAKLTAPV